MRIAVFFVILVAVTGSSAQGNDPLSLEWYHISKRSEPEFIQAVRPDGSGGAYFGSVVDTDSISENVVVRRTESNGTLSWEKEFSFPPPGQSPFGYDGGTSSNVSDLMLDGTGNLHVFGHGDPELTSRAFVAKFDPVGNFQWVAQSELDVDYLYSESQTGAAVDGLGNVFIAGNAGHADYGAYPARHSFVSMFNANGEWQWSNRSLPPEFGNVSHIEPFGNGSAYLYSSRLNSGNVVMRRAMVDASGNFTRLSDFELAVDGNQRVPVYASGNAYILATQGNYPTATYTVTMLDSSGQVAWISEPSAVGQPSGISLAVDNAGRVYISSELAGIESVVVLSNEGNLIGTHTLAIEGGYGFSSIAVDSLGNVFLVGGRSYIDYDIDDIVRETIVVKLSANVPEPSTSFLAMGMVFFFVWRVNRRG